ncbi:MAG: hypothetical protein AB2L12_01030 [Smithellaceae bacterium]
MQEIQPQIDQDLTSLLSRKIEAFEDYYATTALLNQTLAEKDIRKIGTIINLRESQIKNINLIDREIQKLFAGNSPYTKSVNKNVNDLLVKLGKVIKSTQDNDNSCLGSAKALLQETSDDLMSSSNKGFRGYDEKQSRKSRFLDIKT